MTLTLLDDSILLLSVAISTGCVVVLFAFLFRYRRLTSDATKSSQLAKNIWDAMNARLSTMDARIIDVMAKVEIYSTRSSDSTTKPAVTDGGRPKMVSTQAPSVEPSVMSQPVSQASHTSQPIGVRSAPEPTQETEIRILRSLIEGPQTSNQIKVIIDRSREHTARLMKILFEKGLVIRNNRNKPYLYEITDGGRRYLDGI